MTKRIRKFVFGRMISEIPSTAVRDMYVSYNDFRDLGQDMEKMGWYVEDENRQNNYHKITLSLGENASAFLYYGPPFGDEEDKTKIRLELTGFKQVPPEIEKLVEEYKLKREK